MDPIAQRLKTTLEQLRAFERKYGRGENSVQLLAVSKTRSAEDIAKALDSGQKDFGENYLQEAVDKISQLQKSDISWHFIGPVQSNKTTSISANFAWLHSLDRLKIARRLSQSRPPEMTALNVCIQVNISGESSKSGVSVEETETLAEQVADLPGLNLRGLMAMPAPHEDLALQRRGFEKLRQLFDKLVQGGYHLDTLSMGTSNDVEAAIAEGATMVRIGTAIFGPRH